jgi:acyl-ACP thioesterase
MVIPQIEREYRVHVYETSADERLNTCSLFNYMQDIATAHAIELGYGRDELMKNNHLWVLSRMYAVIKERPFRGETILVRTWPYGTDNVFALRFYEIRFPDGRIIASASSSWLVIDATTKRIQRPDQTLMIYNPARESAELPVRIASKLDEASRDGEISPEFRVKLSDLDVNLHANNVNYLKWTLDSYDFDFTMKNVPSSVEINYLAESMLDDIISIKTSGEANSKLSFRHSIIRQADSRVLCRIGIEWKELIN